VSRSGAARRVARWKRALPVSVALCAGLAAACGGGEARPTGTAPEVFVEGAGQVMVGMENFLTRNGVRSAVLRADTAYTFDESGRLELRSVTLVFFGDAGDTTGVLTGREAVYELAAGDVRVRGDVEVRLRSGETFRAPLLAYISASNQIRADSGYVQTLPDGTVDSGVDAMWDLGTDERRYGAGRTTTPEITVPQ
jgi:hypothetical protein